MFKLHTQSWFYNQAHLSYTRSIDSNTSFETIDSAQVIICEDKKEWGILNTTGEGVYGLNKRSEIGKIYSVEATIKNELPLYAETTIPDRPMIDTLTVSRYEDSSFDLQIDYAIQDKVGADFYWNYELLFYSGDMLEFKETIAHVSPYVDSFNRKMDNFEPLGFHYHFYVRQTDEGIDGESLKFTKSLITSKTIDYFFNADKHYDKYVKSRIQSWTINEWEMLPFSEPVQIYSNVENGVGIFGSASFTCINYKERYHDK